MSKAYKCDGCGQFFEHEPAFTLQSQVYVYGDPDGWSFHSFQCIMKWAQERLRK